MPITIELAGLEQQHAINLARWEEILADPEWMDAHPKSVETNRFGQIVMTPPPTYDHDSSCSSISHLLAKFLGPRAFGVIAISTADGTKVADAAWSSPQRHLQNKGKKLATVAPEIVVEVMSPGNSWTELDYKGALYFEAGAQEFWVCDHVGKMHFFLAGDSKAATARSTLCPQFPESIDV